MTHLDFSRIVWQAINECWPKDGDRARRSRTRAPGAMDARHIYRWVMLQKGYTSTRIAFYSGYHHSTVLNSWRQVNKRPSLMADAQIVLRALEQKQRTA